MQVSENTEVKKRVATSKPYKQWLDENRRALEPVKFPGTNQWESDKVLKLQQYVSSVNYTVLVVKF